MSPVLYFLPPPTVGTKAMVVVMAVEATAEGGTYRVGVGDRIAFGRGVATGDLILCFVASGTTALESFLVQFELFLCRPTTQFVKVPSPLSTSQRIICAYNALLMITRFTISVPRVAVAAKWSQ